MGNKCVPITLFLFWVKKIIKTEKFLIENVDFQIKVETESMFWYRNGVDALFKWSDKCPNLTK